VFLTRIPAISVLFPAKYGKVSGLALRIGPRNFDGMKAGLKNSAPPVSSTSNVIFI